MTDFRTLDDGPFAGKRVLVRVDLNVPCENGASPTAPASSASLPTIREIADKGGRVILLAHFGRPKGGPDETNSLRPIADGRRRLHRPAGEIRAGDHRHGG